MLQSFIDVLTRTDAQRHHHTQATSKTVLQALLVGSTAAPASSNPSTDSVGPEPAAAAAAALQQLLTTAPPAVARGLRPLVREVLAAVDAIGSGPARSVADAAVELASAPLTGL